MVLRVPKVLFCPPERLMLLPEGSSAEAMALAASDERITEYLEWKAHCCVDDGRIFLEWCEMELSRETGAHYAILDTENDVLGVAGLTNIDLTSDSAESTIWLTVATWGTGLSQRVRRLLLKVAFVDLGLRKVRYRVDVRNHRNLRSLCPFRPALVDVVLDGIASNAGHATCLILEIEKTSWAWE